MEIDAHEHELVDFLDVVHEKTYRIALVLLKPSETAQLVRSACNLHIILTVHQIGADQLFLQTFELRGVGNCIRTPLRALETTMSPKTRGRSMVMT